MVCAAARPVDHGRQVCCTTTAAEYGRGPARATTAASCPSGTANAPTATRAAATRTRTRPRTRRALTTRGAEQRDDPLSAPWRGPAGGSYATRAAAYPSGSEHPRSLRSPPCAETGSWNSSTNPSTSRRPERTSANRRAPQEQATSWGDAHCRWWKTCRDGRVSFPDTEEGRGSTPPAPTQTRRPAALYADCGSHRYSSSTNPSTPQPGPPATQFTALRKGSAPLPTEPGETTGQRTRL